MELNAIKMEEIKRHNDRIEELYKLLFFHIDEVNKLKYGVQSIVSDN